MTDTTFVDKETLIEADWANDANAVVYGKAGNPYIVGTGSALVGFTQAGTGAVARTSQNKMRDIVSAFDFMDATQIADVKARTQLVDVRASLQAAADYCLSNEKELFMPAGNYAIKSTGPTDLLGNVCGLYVINQLAGPDQYKKLTIRGAGYWSTTIAVDATVAIDTLVAFQFNGDGVQISDLALSAAGGGSVKQCLHVTGNGNVVENIWTGGGDTGFKFGGSLRAKNLISEFPDDYNVWLDECYNTSIDGLEVVTAGTASLRITATEAASSSEEAKNLSGIHITNGNFTHAKTDAVACSIALENANSAVHFTNCLFGQNGFPTGVAGTEDTAYAFTISASGNASITYTNCEFTLTKFGGTVQTAGSVDFIGCNFVKTGFLASAATTWATRDIWISSAARVKVIGCTFRDTSGNCIYSTSCKELTLMGNYFLDCSNGGLDSNGDRNNATDATVGNENIYWRPGATTDVLKMIGNHFDAPAAYNTSKTGLTLDCQTAIPAEGNVVITANSVVASSFATNFTFSGGSYTTADKALWRISEDQLVTSEWTTPAFAAGNFTSDSGTWVVAAGDVTTYAYKIVDKVMHLSFHIVTSTVTGTPGELRIAIPGSKVAAKSTRGLCQAYNGSWAAGAMSAAASGTYISLYSTAALGGWTAGTDDRVVAGSLSFEIN